MKKNKNKIIIFGTGTFAKVIHFYLTNDSQYEVIAFTVNKNHIKEKKLLGLSVVPFENISKLYPPKKFKMFIDVGYTKMNKEREQIYYAAKKKGYQLISYIISKTTHWGDTKMGDNCFIFENNTIQPFVKIGNDVIIWSGNHIGHHASIDDHCFISSHVVIAGGAKIGKNCFLGINTTIRDEIKIANNCLIGAGTLIMKDTKENEVYIGRSTKPDTRDSTKINI